MQSEYENKHVHQVYDQIAKHFSSTRYKPWPVVDKFIKSQETYSLGADIGCGNGKYLQVRSDLCIIGCDRSRPLVEIPHKNNSLVFVADNLSLPIRSNSVDFAISVAVIHHFSTEERRKLAITEIARILKRNARALIFVWAFEQKDRRFDFKDQDVMVPWHLSKSYQTENQENVYNRYYHLFKQGELPSLVASCNLNVTVEEEGYDRDNWYVIIRKNTE